MSVLGVIAARGGSKSIPKKSIAPLVGRPMLAYSCEAALNAEKLDRVILSTDDEEIAEVGRANGVDVPFMRPGELALDDTLMPAVLNHALDWADGEGMNVTAVVLLQATSPLRKACHIDDAVRLFFDQSADTVVSLEEVPHQFNPISVMNLDESGHATLYQQNSKVIMRRQEKPTVYGRNGPAVLVMRPQVLRQGGLYGETTLGYVMDRISSIDIDHPQDLIMAEAILCLPKLEGL